MRGHSVGGFGSVTTNKVIATIAGDVFGKDVQAYPKYGSEKKGLPTTYYLTIADTHIYHAQRAGARRPRRAQRHQRPVQRQPARRPGRRRRDLHAEPVHRAQPTCGQRIPLQHKKTIREKQLRRLLRRHGADRPRGGVASPTCRCACRASCCWARSSSSRPTPATSGMTDDQVYAGVEKALRKYFGKRGDHVVQDNLTCVKRGYGEMQEVPQEMMHAETCDQRARAATDDSSEPVASDIDDALTTRSRLTDTAPRSTTMSTADVPRSMNEANERDPVQQQLLRHARRPRLHSSSRCRSSTSTTSTTASSAATKTAPARRSCPPICRSPAR